MQLLACLLGDVGRLRFSGNNRRFGRMKQPLQIGLEIAAVFRPEVDKFKRLKVAFGRPHRKQHPRFGSHGVFSNMEDDFDLDSFVQGRLQMQQPTGNRELV